MTREDVDFMFRELGKYGEVSRETHPMDTLAYGIVHKDENGFSFSVGVWATECGNNTKNWAIHSDLHVLYGSTVIDGIEMKNAKRIIKNKDTFVQKIAYDDMERLFDFIDKYDEIQMVLK